MAVFGTLLVLLAIVGAGAAAKRYGLLPPAASETLNPLIINITLPALIVSSVLRADIKADLFWLPLSAMLLMTLMGVLAFAVSRLMRFSGPMTGAFILAVAQGNTAFIGYPVIQSALGSDGLLRAIFFDNGVALVVLTAGVVVARHFGEPGLAAGGASHSEGPIWRELISFPPLLALPAALALRYLTVPAPVTGTLSLLGAATIPLALISVGLAMQAGGLAGNAGKVAMASSMKLLLSPLLILTSVWAFFGLAPGSLSAHLTASVALLQAAMPTGVMTVVLSERYGLDTPFLAATVLVTTVAAALTLPVITGLAG